MSFGAHACDGSGQRNVMTRKTVILTEIIAPYRIPVFNAHARRAGVDRRQTRGRSRHAQIYGTAALGKHEKVLVLQ
jgi:hypothetical protein